MDASQLLVRPPDVTRSTVQKAVVVIADSPQYFGMLRESLSVVTQAWFAQREFGDTDILRRFQENLAEEKERGALNRDEDRDQYLGMSLRELVREFRWQTLVLLKCCLLQPKVRLDKLPPPWRQPFSFACLGLVCVCVCVCVCVGVREREVRPRLIDISRCSSSARGASGYA
jgi:hypothetical protein